MRHEPTHEIRIPENEQCRCHDLRCTWDHATQMWYHPDGSPVGGWRNWPLCEELMFVPTDEPPEDTYPVALYDGEVVRGYFDDGTTGDPEDDYWFHHEDWFVSPDRCLAIRADEIPDGWLHEIKPEEVCP